MKVLTHKNHGKILKNLHRRKKRPNFRLLLLHLQVGGNAKAKVPRTYILKAELEIVSCLTT